MQKLSEAPGTSSSPTQRETVMQQYPLTPSERYSVAASKNIQEIVWAKEKYGEKIFSLLSLELFGVVDQDEDVRRAQLYTRHGIQALEIGFDFSLPQDAQTGLILAKNEPDSVDSLRGVHKNIQRGINGVQIHRTGVTGIDVNPSTAFLPSVLQLNEVMRSYMTSVPQLSPQQGETESQLQQRLFQERRNAFVLYKDLMEAEQLQGLHVSDLQNILEVCFRLCNGQNPSFVLTTGYGGSEDQPSTRMPSYIAGACEIMSIFMRHKNIGTIRFMPKFRILNAYKIAGLVNHMDNERIRSSAYDMQRVLRAFLHHFMPNVAEHVNFETDEEISYPTLEESQEYFAHLPADHPSHQKIASQAERMMKKERLTNRDDAVHRVQQYIAAHISLFLDVIAPDWHEGTPYFQKKPDIVWSVGGKGEQFFNEFRRMFSEDRNGPDHLHASYHPLSIRTLQKTGQYPPYYHLPDVDSSIYQLNGQPIVPDFTAIKDKVVSKSMATDYKSLISMVKKATAKERGAPENTIGDAEADDILKSFFLGISKP